MDDREFYEGLIVSCEANLAAIAPDSPLNRYRLETIRATRDCARELIAGRSFEEATDRMWKRDAEAAARHDVKHLL